MTRIISQRIETDLSWGRDGTHERRDEIYEQPAVRQRSPPVPPPARLAAAGAGWRVRLAAGPPPGAHCPQLRAAAIALGPRHEMPVCCNASDYFGDRLFWVTSLHNRRSTQGRGHIHSWGPYTGQVMWRGLTGGISTDLSPSRPHAPNPVSAGTRTFRGYLFKTINFRKAFR